jgi:enoyl-CoA hydratase/carnithine racemase
MWATKENLNYARDHTVEEGLNYISLWNAATLHQEDIMTSMSAKMAKQKPKYKDLRDKNFLNHKGSKK